MAFAFNTLNRTLPPEANCSGSDPFNTECSDDSQYGVMVLCLIAAGVLICAGIGTLWTYKKCKESRSYQSLDDRTASIGSADSEPLADSSYHPL